MCASSGAGGPSDGETNPLGPGWSLMPDKAQRSGPLFVLGPEGPVCRPGGTTGFQGRPFLFFSKSARRDCRRQAGSAHGRRKMFAPCAGPFFLIRNKSRFYGAWTKTWRIGGTTRGRSRMASRPGFDWMLPAACRFEEAGAFARSGSIVPGPAGRFRAGGRFGGFLSRDCSSRFWRHWVPSKRDRGFRVEAFAESDRL